MKLDLSREYDINRGKTYLAKLIKSGARIELKKYQERRTIQQNSYFHVACKILSDYSGYTVPEMKIIIKDQLEFMVYEKKGHRFYKSTSDLTKEEFSELIEFVRGFGETHGCYIPSPEEHITSQFEIERELQI